MRRFALAPAIGLIAIGVGSCHTDWVHGVGAAVDAMPPPLTTIPIEGFERDGAAIAVGRVNGRTLAFVADEDEDALHTIDLDQRIEIARTELEGRPTRAVILPSGDVAVALRDDASIAVLAMTAPNQPLMMRASINTEDEPIALATSPNGEMLYVASGLGHALEGFSLASFTKKSTIALGREPRALTISSDGARAIVGYMSESGVSVVDLPNAQASLTALKTKANQFGDFEAPSKPRSVRQVFALVRIGTFDEKVLAPMQLVEPGEATVISSGYGSSMEPAVEFDLAVLDGRTGIGDPRGFGLGPEFDCRLPRGAAVDGKGKVAVACMGSDAVAVFDGKYGANGPHEYRHMVSGGPSAIAFDPVHDTFLALATFTRHVHVITAKKSIPIALSHEDGKGLPSDAAEGRKLFFAANDDRISFDGRACASCHPDGRDDGLVWSTPKGPRQTVHLAGRLARPAPFGWDGKHASLAAHIKITMQNLQGTGLPKDAVEKLSAYLVRIPVPPKRDHDLTPEQKKGEMLFASSKVGCGGCHNDTAAFDVASATKTDKTKTFLAPSLRFIGATAPYFHDGRYPTLASMLRAKDNSMSAPDLADDDVKALEAYLMTL
jgi:cytochrome c peroxidase